MSFLQKHYPLLPGDVSHAGSHAPGAAQDAAGAGSLGKEAEPGEGGPVARPDLGWGWG